MQSSFSWRKYSPNTLRAFEQAARDFSTVTGRRIDLADVECAQAWLASMQGRKLSDSTIRQRIAALRLISGLQVTLPVRAEALVFGERSACKDLDPARTGL